MNKEQNQHLQQSIAKFGLIDKPVLNKDNTIIGGHQRIRILKKMKAKEVECWVPNAQLNEKDIDELNIRLNKNTGFFDFDVLANEWDALDLLEWGFKENELFGAFNEVLDNERVSEKKKKKSKKSSCPACGHEF